MKKVYLVGAGPGDPGLITVKGLGILKQADVIIYDYLVDKRLLEFAKEGAELICQENGNKKVIEKAKEGKRVIRLKNGDPSIFSRLSQELDELVKNKIEFEVVPGVTAASAASCFSGVPLTDRKYSSSVVFVTGHEAGGKSTIDWKSIANCGTIVLYMAVENISEIAEKLILAGKPKDTPVIAVSSVGKVTQRILKLKLENLRSEKGINPPTIFIITKKAKIKSGERILFTGLSKERFFLNGSYVHLPLIKIRPLDDYTEFDNYLRDIKRFNWIVFTSRYGVEYFFKRLKTRMPNDIKIAVIGNSTKDRLMDFGIIADLVPKKESSEGLIEAFREIDIKGDRVFLPRSDISDKGLEEEFRRLGAKVSSGVAYRNVMPDDLPDLDLCSFDEIIFTSPSGVRNFIKRYGIPKKIKKRYIGDVTKREAKRWKLED